MSSSLDDISQARPPSPSACYPRGVDPGDAFCPVYEAINLLQEKWTLHIVRALLEGDKGFNQLARWLKVNPATLSQRLERLVALGVVEKEVLSSMPPRTRYRLTQAGRELEAVIAAIEAWGRKYLKPVPDRRT